MVYACFILGVIPLGLATRHFELFPGFVKSYAGDALWALTLYLVIRIILIRTKFSIVGALSLFLAFCVEISQLLDYSWLIAVRETVLGVLVLGRDFLLSDLVCYAVGVSIGILLDVLIEKRRPINDFMGVTDVVRGN